jgi:crotonobetainyl-CoA:carnitine CoA-transferase CaiB-like acyl-CoA transferase
MTQVLEGIRVVEVDNWGFAPSAGVVLADWGADVIKVEDPRRGDPLRGIFGAVDFGDGAMRNFLHEQWNRNKRSIGLDLAAPDGRAALDDLVAGADVFITNYLPDIRARLRLDAADLRAVNPTLVYALATGQGSKGPDAGKASFDYVSAWARAGVGERLTAEGAPFAAQRPGMCDTTGGNFLAGAIAAALVRKLRTGEGVDVEISLLATGGWMLGPDIANFLTNGFELPRSSPEGTGAGPLMTWYECGDGKRLVFTMMQPERYWPQVCEALELDVLTDDRFDTPEKRALAGAERLAIIGERLATRTRAEWAEVLNAADIVWGPVQSPSEYVVDPMVVANGYLVTVDHPTRGETQLVASPAQFDNHPIVGRSSAPDLGQHTDEVFAELGWDAARIAAARDAGTIA